MSQALYISRQRHNAMKLNILLYSFSFEILWVLTEMNKVFQYDDRILSEMIHCIPYHDTNNLHLYIDDLVLICSVPSALAIHILQS